MELAMLTSWHADFGIEAFGLHGFVIPKCWAHADREVIVASPGALEQDRMTDDRILTVLVAIAGAIDANVIGRTDEVWTRTVTPEQAATVKPGDISAMADEDPEIRTAVVTHAGDIKSGEQAIHIATSHIDDFELITWDRTNMTELSGAKSEQMQRAIVLVREDRRRLLQRISARTMLRTLDGVGWSARRWKL